MNYLLIFLFILILLNLNEGYLNYQELSYKGDKKNCPQLHANNYKKILNSNQVYQPFGYIKNEYLDKLRYYETDQPLPVDPDFFNNL
tara:strand:- start:809 stop:1069 length:261 start_codon:yes stop_codon:yes gene_type:complete